MADTHHRQDSPPSSALQVPPPGPWWQQVLAGAAALVIGLGTLWLLQLLAWPLALFIGGLALAAGLAPVINYLAGWLPRSLAVVLFYLLIVLILVGIGWLVVPPMVTQTQQALDQLPDTVGRIEATLSNWIPMANNISLTNLLSGATSGTQSLLSTASTRLTDWTIAVLVVLFTSIYTLILAPKADDFVLSLFPERRRDRVQHVMSRMAEAMGGWVRGTLISCTIIGVLTALGLWVLGYDLPIALGIIAGVMEIIPTLGPLVTGVLIVFVGLLQSGTKALIGLAFAILLQQIESNIVTPNVMKSQAHISPLIVLLALVAGERIGGLVGALIAIPLVAALRVFIVEVVAPMFREWTGAPPLEEQEDEDE